MRFSPMGERYSRHLRAAGISLLLAIVASACASTGDARVAAGPPEKDRPRSTQASRILTSSRNAPAFAYVSAKDSLGVVVRDLSEKSHRSVALMNGIDLTLQVGPYDSKKLTVAEWMDRIAADAGLQVEHAANYDFFYPSGYEALIGRSIASRLDPTLAALPASARFDLDTPLFSALALLSHSLKTAIVADNIVADARCGETQLFDLSVADALDALLRSARVADAAIKVQSAPGYTFLYSPAHPLRDKTLAALPGDPRPAWLDRRVTLHLPAAPADPEHLLGYANAVSLQSCLAEISKQLGVRVEADTRALPLPINPSVMTGVTIQTALDLIVNQWPLPHFGYRVSGDVVHFVYLGPPIGK